MPGVTELPNKNLLRGTSMRTVWVIFFTILFAGCTGMRHHYPARNNAIIDYDMGIDGQLSSLSTQVAVQLSAGACKNVIVNGFYDDRGKKGRLEKYLDVEFANRLIKTGMFRVYSSEELGDAEKIEQRRDEKRSGQQQAGNRNTGGQQIFTASLIGATFELPQSVKVSVKLICSRSGMVFGTAAVLLHKDNTVESLLDNFGVQANTSFRASTSSRIGRIIKAGDNQYIELIPREYTLYVKQVNFEYSLFSSRPSYAEIFINDEYRVMKEDDMIALNFDDERYLLSLRNIAEHTATFTFAYLSQGDFPATDNFSKTHPDPFSEKASDENTTLPVEQDISEESLKENTPLSALADKTRLANANADRDSAVSDEKPDPNKTDTQQNTQK